MGKIKDVENRLNIIEGEANGDSSFVWQLLKEYSRSNIRMFAALVAVLVLWFSTIGGFIWYLYQYDFTSESVVVDSGDSGSANYIGNDGDIVNGESGSEAP